jgi:hypothetical protein
LVTFFATKKVTRAKRESLASLPRYTSFHSTHLNLCLSSSTHISRSADS